MVFTVQRPNRAYFPLLASSALTLGEVICQADAPCMCLCVKDEACYLPTRARAVQGHLLITALHMEDETLWQAASLLTYHSLPEVTPTQDLASFTALPLEWDRRMGAVQRFGMAALDKDPRTSFPMLWNVLTELINPEEREGKRFDLLGFSLTTKICQYATRVTQDIKASSDWGEKAPPQPSEHDKIKLMQAIAKQYFNPF